MNYVRTYVRERTETRYICVSDDGRVRYDPYIAILLAIGDPTERTETRYMLGLRSIDEANLDPTLICRAITDPHMEPALCMEKKEEKPDCSGTNELLRILNDHGFLPELSFNLFIDIFWTGLESARALLGCPRCTPKYENFCPVYLKWKQTHLSHSARPAADSSRATDQPAHTDASPSKNCRQERKKQMK